MMDKDQVAQVLDEIGTLLELQGENPFRTRAYTNAARVIQQLETNLADLVATNKLGDIPGIGETLREKITALVTTGKLAFYDELKAKTPAGLLQMLRLPGLGPKKVKALYDELKITSLDQLKEACAAGKVAALKGFGAKTQQKILEGIAFIGEASERVRIDQALPLGLALVEAIRKFPQVKRIQLCGSLRRRRETAKDIDIVASADDPHAVMDQFVKLPNVRQVVAHGPTKSTITVGGHDADMARVLLNADLRVVRDDQFASAIHHFSGSKEHNIALRSRAQHQGYKINEYELMGPTGPVPVRDETELYRTLGLDYIPPELREDTGEIDAAEHHRLPKLVEGDDIRGVFHCHTTWSDGSNSVREMADAAKKLGLEYFGFGDHSQSLTVANGLTPERVREQQAEIDDVAAHLKGIRLFKGIECDILADGSLDYDDKVLASFDYVVASVHSHFGQTEKEMTERIVRAISHPLVTMLGHATGRLLLRRDGYKVDLEAVLQAAAKHGTLIEINAHPVRLDLDWIHCKRAKALGVKLVINPDAHSTHDIAYYRYGVDVARRGWLEKADVFNTLTAAEVAKALAARRGG
jgi:DNA polymerase (family 10)